MKKFFVFSLLLVSTSQVFAQQTDLTKARYAFNVAKGLQMINYDSATTSKSELISVGLPSAIKKDERIYFMGRMTKSQYEFLNQESLKYDIQLVFNGGKFIGYGISE